MREYCNAYFKNEEARVLTVWENGKAKFHGIINDGITGPEIRFINNNSNPCDMVIKYCPMCGERLEIKGE